jgi:glutamine synthetase
MINKPESRQTVEFRCPDGSANAHLLLAGITMAAEWGLTNKKESMQLARMSHVSVNIHSSPSMEDLAELATSCYESSERLLQSRNLYERGDVFPQNMIYYIANQLQNENDRGLNSRLISLTEDERIFQSRRIMHKDLHKH